MSNPIVSELKNQKKLLLSLIGLVAVIVLGTSFRYGGYDLGGLNTYPGANGGSSFNVNDNDSSGNNVVVTNKLNKYKTLPAMDLKNGVDYRAEIETSMGTIKIDLFERDTPVTVNSFVFLANEKYYNDMKIHYVKKGKLVQTGDPLGNGSGGPGYTFKDEIDAVAIGLNSVTVGDSPFLARLYDQLDPYTKPFAPENLQEKKDLTLKQFYEQDFGFAYSVGVGTYKIAPYFVAMANSGPNSNGSQFFITTKGFNDQSLLGRHTVFGRVSGGFDVVDKIENVQVDAVGAPKNDIKILKVTISEL